jgi:uncharacterized DUF497 family protein
MKSNIKRLKLLGFEWDKGNKYKNWEKHKVDFREGEEIFFNRPFKTFYDAKHSQKEPRFITLGITNKGKKLIVVFTVRNKKIRVISGRNQSKKDMKQNKKLKSIPKFKNEDEEREFWATHDLTEFLHQFRPIELDLSELRPSTKSVTIRLPESLLATLKNLAHKRDVPYQSLMKIFLAERVKKELAS